MGSDDKGHHDRDASSSLSGVQVRSLDHEKREPNQGWIIAAIVIGVGIIALGVCVVMAMPKHEGDQNNKASDGVDAEKARSNAALTTSSTKGNQSPPAGGLGFGLSPQPESREPGSPHKEPSPRQQGFTYGAPPTQNSPSPRKPSPRQPENSTGSEYSENATVTPANTPPAGGVYTQADSLLGTSLSQTSLRGFEQPGGLKHSHSASSSEFATNTATIANTADITGSTASLQFCPNLVVPEGCECILFVPLRTMAGGPFTVADINGKLVLRVTQQCAAHQFAPQQPSAEGQGNPSVFRSLVLTTSSGGVLAQCCAAKPSAPPGTPGEAEFHLLRASGEYFARLVRSSASEDYMLDCLSGMRLHFSGTFEEHIVRVTDDDGLLVATTEPCTVDFEEGSYDRLRVAPLTDVGLVLCSLLCLDHLGEGQA